jgi:hypothetical protein
MNDLSELLGSSPEAPLQSAVYGVMGELTRRIGCVDEWLEHNSGETPLSVGIVGEPLRTICTITELADLIAGDAEKSDQEHTQPGPVEVTEAMAGRIVAAVLVDLKDRRGIRQAFDGIDDDVQAEIKVTLTRIVREATLGGDR